MVSRSKSYGSGSKKSQTEYQKIGYCLRCRKRVRMEDSKVIERKNGRFTMTGKCPQCGTTVNRFISTK